MNKSQLLKYAEEGVRQRLQEIQVEINALARDFPHIVCHADGSVPAVTPITAKAASIKDPAVSQKRKAEWARLTPDERAARSAKMQKAREKNRRAKEAAARKSGQ